MSVRLIETDAGVVSGDCWYHCAPGVKALCDDEECQCECHADKGSNEEGRENQ